ncbi:MAG TPA: tetratricopeptide repeat protein [Thiotrichales bacterium]|nr:tetratricopeptide repeat protein [Thiotrichales bacterium]
MHPLKNYLTATLFFLLSFSAQADESVWQKSYALQAKGDYAGAANVLKAASTAGDEFSVLRLAYLSYLQGNYGDAIDRYQQAIDMNPESIDARLGITLPLMAQKRWKQVKHYCMQVLRQSHWHYTAHVRLMIAEEGLRNWADLASHASQLARVYPSDATALVYLARAHAWQGDTAAALTAYKQVLKRIPAHIEAGRYIAKNNP